MSRSQSIKARVDRLHAGGLVDMHFDLPLGLQWNGDADVIAKEFLPDFFAGDIGVLGVATYVEDRFLPDKGLNIALGQVARLYAGAERARKVVVCKTYRGNLADS